ncbi:MAG: poly-gamma-glutamate system protein [Candidatus Eisenbacteria bacterium]|nr:poly-gamma-glutamate system protein [Candidatus Eisenbacteria bacterium]
MCACRWWFYTEVIRLRWLFSDQAPWSRRVDVFLVGLAVLGIGFHALGEVTKRLRPQPHMPEKMAAATRTVRCYEAIRQVRIGSPATLDAESDPASTGLIGQEFTLTTTDRGVLRSKLTSVNPNFAALFVQYYRDLQLQPGDAVALALTGSFPALNIAALAAAEELNLRPLPITSVGASMWGSNDPYFSWLDMEAFLNQKWLLRTRSIAASLGGSNDRGRGLSPKGRGLLKDAVERNGIELIYEKTLEESITKRLEIYDREAGPGGIKAFVNVGGGAAAIGSSLNGRLIQPGITRSLRPYNWAQRGVLHHFARRGVPIIHVLRVQSLAREHGFPVAPVVVPAVGEGKIYYKPGYDLRVVVPILLVYLVLCFGVLRVRQQAAKAAHQAAALKSAVSGAASATSGGERRSG